MDIWVRQSCVRACVRALLMRACVRIVVFVCVCMVCVRGRTGGAAGRGEREGRGRDGYKINVFKSKFIATLVACGGN